MGFASIAFAVLTGLSLPGLTEASVPFRAEATGVTLRLLAQPPDADGLVRGVVAIDLEPGWKTYWTTPGGVGLSPSFVLSGHTETEQPAFHFPAPLHLTEEDAPFNGYDAPMAVAFETKAPAGGAIELEIAIGVCRTVCVPVMAQLSRDLSQPLSVEDSNAIDRAFLALPAESSETLAATVNGDDLLVRAANGATGELFVSASESGWDFGVASNEGAGWRIPVLRRPSDAPDTPVVLDAVLDDGARARHIVITVD